MTEIIILFSDPVFSMVMLCRLILTTLIFKKKVNKLQRMLPFKEYNHPPKPLFDEIAVYHGMNINQVNRFIIAIFNESIFTEQSIQYPCLQLKNLFRVIHVTVKYIIIIHDQKYNCTSKLRIKTNIVLLIKEST